MSAKNLFRIFVFSNLAILPLSATAQISIPESVLTGRNGVRRTGVYDHETKLNPTSVASGRFRLLVTRSVSGQVAAQPLYVKGVVINGAPKNVVYVVTRQNFIYAFDADNIEADVPRQGQVWANPIHLIDCDPRDTGSPSTCWREAVPLRGMGPPFPPNGQGCRQTIGPAGITSTPVIDPVLQRMYLVARFGAPKSSQDDYGKHVAHYVVSLDLKTGQELRRQRIGDTLGTAFAGFGELNRAALLLLNNVLYIAFGAPVCDEGEDITRANSHGWVFAYSVPDMTYLDSYNTSPKTGLAGIWQSGAGLAADPQRGFVYALTGNNGDPDRVGNEQTGKGSPEYNDLYHPSRQDLGESILRFSFVRLGPIQTQKFKYDPRFINPVVEHFTAGNWFRLDKGDTDIGAGGPVVLSNGLVLGGGKQGRVYVLSPDQDFRNPVQTFQATVNTWHLGSQTTCTKGGNPANEPGCVISQEDYDFAEAWGPNIHGSPVVWERPSKPGGFLFVMGEKDYLRAYPIVHTGRIVETAKWTSERALLTGLRWSPSLRWQVRAPDGMPGGFVSLSSNGDSDGIVWVSVSPTEATYRIQPGVLVALNAETGDLLWADDDPTVSFAKFVPPTIAGGKVFRAAFSDPKRRDCPSEQADEFEGASSCGSILIYGLTGFRPIQSPTLRPHPNHP